MCPLKSIYILPCFSIITATDLSSDKEPHPTSKWSGTGHSCSLDCSGPADSKQTTRGLWKWHGTSFSFAMYLLALTVVLTMLITGIRLEQNRKRLPGQVGRGSPQIIYSLATLENKENSISRAEVGQNHNTFTADNTKLWLEPHHWFSVKMNASGAFE